MKNKTKKVIICMVIMFLIIGGIRVFAAETEYNNFWNMVKLSYNSLKNIKVGDYCDDTIYGIGRDYFPKSICIHPSQTQLYPSSKGYMDVGTIVDTVTTTVNDELTNPLQLKIQEIGTTDRTVELDGTGLASYIGYWAEKKVLEKTPIDTYWNLDNNPGTTLHPNLKNKFYQEEWSYIYASANLPQSTSAWRQFMYTVGEEKEYEGTGTTWATSISPQFHGLVYDGYKYGATGVLEAGSYRYEDTECFVNASAYENFLQNNKSDFYIKGGELYTEKTGSSKVYELTSSWDISNASFPYSNDNLIDLGNTVEKDGRRYLKLMFEAPVVPSGSESVVNMQIVYIDDVANETITTVEETINSATGQYDVYIDVSNLELDTNGNYRVKVGCAYNLYKARILGMRINGIQKNAIISGCLMKHETCIAFTAPGQADVSVDKSISQVITNIDYRAEAREGKLSSWKNTNKVNVEIGDVIEYKIKIINNGTTSVTMDIIDTFDSNIFEVDSRTTGWTSSGNTLTKDNVVIDSDGEEFYVYLKIKGELEKRRIRWN